MQSTLTVTVMLAASCTHVPMPTNAGTGNCVQFPFQSFPVASLAWLGKDRHAPCFFQNMLKVDSLLSEVHRHTHTHTPKILKPEMPFRTLMSRALGTLGGIMLRSSFTTCVSAKKSRSARDIGGLNLEVEDSRILLVTSLREYPAGVKPASF